MRDVQPRAGQFGELHVAGDADGFRRSRHAAQAEARGRDSFAHHRAGGQRNVFGVFDHGKIQRAAIIHHLTSQFGGGDGFAVIADGDDAGFLHGGNFRDGFAFAADAGGADGPHAHAARLWRDRG